MDCYAEKIDFSFTWEDKKENFVLPKRKSILNKLPQGNNAFSEELKGWGAYNSLENATGLLKWCK